MEGVAPRVLLYMRAAVAEELQVPLGPAKRAVTVLKRAAAEGVAATEAGHPTARMAAHLRGEPEAIIPAAQAGAQEAIRVPTVPVAAVEAAATEMRVASAELAGLVEPARNGTLRMVLAVEGGRWKR
jgi:hypothetical protein